MTQAQLTRRDDLRNIAIIAHVDHGKTTLVDALLHQSGIFRANEQVAERVMDSMDLERERGITIMAKNTSIHYGNVKINIVDTPGHADFGGEVERTLAMVDGVMLLVDASEGPLPQTRFVLKKALEAKLTPIVCINKIDRPDARIAVVLDEIYDLFIDLDASEDQLDFPVVYTNARAGTATLDLKQPGENLKPMFELIVEHPTGPKLRPGDADAIPSQQPRLQRLRRPAGGRPSEERHARAGTIHALPRRRQASNWSRSPKSMAGRDSNASKSHRCKPATSPPSPASRISASAIPSPTAKSRKRCRRCASTNRPSPCFSAPTIRPGPAAKANIVTSRKLRERLFFEQRRNVSLRVEETAQPDAFQVTGRGEFALAIIIETMRREGYEMMVSKPTVITREIDGAIHEPMELLVIDIPEDFIGVVSQLLAMRKGKMTKMITRRLEPRALGICRAVARLDRLSLAFSHRHPRHRHHERAVQRLGALAWHDSIAHQRRHGRRPRRPSPALCDFPFAGTRRACSSRRAPKFTKAWWSASTRAKTI